MNEFPKCQCFRCTGKRPAEIGHARSLLHVEYIEEDEIKKPPMISGTFKVNSDKIDGEFNIKDTTSGN